MRVIVVGGGTAGATFAGTLAARRQHEVILLEAGPDYGAFDDHFRPSELLDSRQLGLSHDWGLVNRDNDEGRTYPLERAKVMGGCSAHNGCAAIRGLESDYRAWAEEIDPFWQPELLTPDFEAVEKALQVRDTAWAELTPFHQACYRGAIQAGLPPRHDMLSLDQQPGVSVWTMNKRGILRWNAAFAFLDPVRESGHLQILGNCAVEQLVLRGERVVGVRARQRGEAFQLEADLVVLASGTYGTPMLLLRSGIGDPALLGPAGLPCHHPLKGVGRGLQDHPAVTLRYEPSEGLSAAMDAYETERPAVDEGIVLQLASSRAETSVDLHIFPAAGWLPGKHERYWEIGVGLLTPRSRGLIRPVLEENRLTFRIEHRHFSDPEGHDLAALTEGALKARALAGTSALSEALAAEILPGPQIAEGALPNWIGQNHGHYWHPAASCPMGRDPEAGAVVDGRGRLHGLAGLMAVDAAMMPRVVATNTNLPVAMMAHRLARHLPATV